MFTSYSNREADCVEYRGPTCAWLHRASECGVAEPRMTGGRTRFPLVLPQTPLLPNWAAGFHTRLGGGMGDVTRPCGLQVFFPYPTKEALEVVGALSSHDRVAVLLELPRAGGTNELNSLPCRSQTGDQGRNTGPMAVLWRSRLGSSPPQTGVYSPKWSAVPYPDISNNDKLGRQRRYA